MNYCEYIEYVFSKCSILVQRLFEFHVKHGKYYLTELNNELKDIQQSKVN